jgi:hypothetical protein
MVLVKYKVVIWLHNFPLFFSLEVVKELFTPKNPASIISQIISQKTMRGLYQKKQRSQDYKIPLQIQKYLTSFAYQSLDWPSSAYEVPNFYPPSRNTESVGARGSKRRVFRSRLTAKRVGGIPPPRRKRGEKLSALSSSRRDTPTVRAGGLHG